MEIIALIIALLALGLAGAAFAQLRQINQRLQGEAGRQAQSLPPGQEERKVAQLAHRVEILEAMRMPPARPDMWDAPSSSSESYNPALAVSLETNNAPFMAEIRQLIRENKKIQAIKLYREHTQAGLKEAKDTVDAIEAQMRWG